MLPQKRPPIPEIATKLINEKISVFGRPKDIPNTGIINVRNEIGINIPKLTSSLLSTIGGIEIIIPNTIITKIKDSNTISPRNIAKIIDKPSTSPFIPA